MTTVFIALQCFQCSTMQVKQRKKSSNKWTCVICNAKQSVRKVFSQAYMAKDVRKFVQSFNMSRQFVEQQQELRDETLGYQVIDNETLGYELNRKRTDWSEYIDPDVNDTSDDHGELEPNVVTELPKPLFKKPKLRDNYSASGLNCADGEKLRRPVFGKRNAKMKDEEPRTTVKENFRRVGENQVNYEYANKEIGGSSIQREYYKSQYQDNVDQSFVYKSSSSVMTKIRRPACDNVDHSFAYKSSSSMMTKIRRPACDNVDHGSTNIGSSSVLTKLKRPVSKWNDFIDDADDLQLESRCPDINHAAFETKVTDEIVEDDVHPDFL